jgi:gliding motility-associated-like protein
MRHFYSRFLLILIFIAASARVMGQAIPQECTGSLGDPVVFEDFGTNTPNDVSTQTNLQRQFNCLFDEGTYNLIKNISNCHEGAWHQQAQDHTGNGYMMVINSSEKPSLLYTKTIGPLCPGSKYLFSAYILNLMRASASNNSTAQPNITFLIETTSGQFLDSINTGKILPTEITNNWVPAALYFINNTNEEYLVLKMKNNAPGGGGNDFLLDDISFRACGPNIDRAFESTTETEQAICVGQSRSFTLKAKVMDTGYEYQWQVDKGNGWQDINGADNSTALTENLKLNTEFQNAQVGIYKYRLGAAKTGNMASLNCRVYSEALTITVEAPPVAGGLSADYTVCEGGQLSIPALTGGEKYQIYGPGKPITEQAAPVTLNNIGLQNAGEYTVRAVSAIGCVGPEVKFNIKVKKNYTAAIDVAAVTLCTGETVKLTASQLGGDVNDTFTYEWFPVTGLDHTDQAVVNASPSQTTTYKVIIRNGVCEQSKEVTVTVNTVPVITSNFGTSFNNTGFSICQGDNIGATLTAHAPVGYKKYQWQKLSDNNVWENIAGQTAEQLFITTGSLPAANYQYRVATYPDSNIPSVYCRAYSNICTLYVNEILQVAPMADKIVCAGSTIQLDLPPGITYRLTGPGISTIEKATPLIILNPSTQNTGVYTLRAISSLGCPGPAVNFNITIKPLFAVKTTAATTVCPGEQVQLDATVTGGDANDTYTYKWTPADGLDRTDIANPVVTVTRNQPYTVEVSNQTCTNYGVVNIYAIAAPVISITEERAITEGQSITLDGKILGNYNSFSWLDTQWMNNPASLTPVVSPKEDIYYKLNVMADCGFTETRMVFVRVYKNIIIPNTFTPNGDGINDVWNITALFTYPQSVTTIFNRYGQQLYRSIGYSKPWDGRYNGTAMPPGTYYYVIDLKNNTPKQTGYVTILK